MPNTALARAKTHKDVHQCRKQHLFEYLQGVWGTHRLREIFSLPDFWRLLHRRVVVLTWGLMKTLVDRHRYHRGRVAQWIARMPTSMRLTEPRPWSVDSYFCMSAYFLILALLLCILFMMGSFVLIVLEGWLPLPFFFWFVALAPLPYKHHFSVDLRLLLLCLFLILFSLVLSSLAHFLCRQDGSKKTILGGALPFYHVHAQRDDHRGKETMQKGAVVCFRNV